MSLRRGVPGPSPSCLVKSSQHRQESRRTVASITKALAPQILMFLNVNILKFLLLCLLSPWQRQEPGSSYSNPTLK